MYIIMPITKSGKSRKREIRVGNRLELNKDKYNCSDNLNYQETINNEKHSLSRISCNNDSSVTDIRTVLCYVCNKKWQNQKGEIVNT